MNSASERRSSQEQLNLKMFKHQVWYVGVVGSMGFYIPASCILSDSPLCQLDLLYTVSRLRACSAVACSWTPFLQGFLSEDHLTHISEMS